MKKVKQLKTHYVFLNENNIKVAIPLQLKADLDIRIDDMIHSEMDIVIVIDGHEGVGKSRTLRVLGSYISDYTGVDFGPDNIHFNVKDYINSAEDKKSGKYHINCLDESREALNRRRGMAKGNVKFLNWLSENRDKQQVHIIVLPAIHDLESYVTNWRMGLFIHHLKTHGFQKGTLSGYKLVRGYFKVFNKKALQKVIMNSKKYGYYSYPRNYRYRRKFLDTEPFTDKQLAAYKKKKAEKRAEKYVEKEKKIGPGIELLSRVVEHKHSQGLSFRDMAKDLGVPRATVFDYYNKYVKPKSKKEARPVSSTP